MSDHAETYAQFVAETFEQNGEYKVVTEGDMRAIKRVLHAAGFRFNLKVEDKSLGHKVYRFKKL